MTLARPKPRRFRRILPLLDSCEDRILMATAPPLGAAASFVVLGGTTVTNTGLTSLVGDVGVSPGTSVTGFFPPGIVSGGAIHTNDTLAGQAEAALATAYTSLAGEAVDTSLTGQGLGGLTLTPGVYNFATSAALNGVLTLDAQGNSHAIFVIQVGTTLTTSTNSSRHPDQRGPRRQRLLAGGQLGDPRDRQRVRGQHPRVHQHHPEHRRQHLDRPGPGHQRRGDPGHELRLERRHHPVVDHPRQSVQALRRRPAAPDRELLGIHRRRHRGQPHDPAHGDHHRHRRQPGRPLRPHRLRRHRLQLHHHLRGWNPLRHAGGPDDHRRRPDQALRRRAAPADGQLRGIRQQRQRGQSHGPAHAVDPRHRRQPRRRLRHRRRRRRRRQLYDQLRRRHAERDRDRLDDHRRRPDQALRRRSAPADGQLCGIRQRRDRGRPHRPAHADDRRHRRQPCRRLRYHRRRRRRPRLCDQLRRRFPRRHARGANHHRRRPGQALRLRAAGVHGQLRRLRQRRHFRQPDDLAHPDVPRHRRQPRRHLCDHPRRGRRPRLRDQLRRRFARRHAGLADDQRG